MMNTIFIFTTSMVIPVLLMSLTWMTKFATYTNNRCELSAFECGFEQFDKARAPFSFRFFLLAIIFIMFDIEITMILSLPLMSGVSFSETWASSLNLFIIIILAGTVHEWNEGSLSWSI